MGVRVKSCGVWCHFQQYFSCIIAVGFIGGWNWRKPLFCRESLTKFEYRVQLAWGGFELTALVVIGTDCIDSYKSNYYAITTMWNRMKMSIHYWFGVLQPYLFPNEWPQSAKSMFLSFKHRENKMFIWIWYVFFSLPNYITQRVMWAIAIIWHSSSLYM